MAKKFIPAWERTVRIALENTPWDSLRPEEQQAVQHFVTERHKGDTDKASALLTQLIPQVALRKALPLGVIILLWVLALIAAPVLCLAFGTKWLAPALLVCLVVELCTGKNERMNKLWNTRSAGAEGVSAALKGMFRVTLRSPLKAEPVKLGVMAAALVLLTATWFLPEPSPDAAESLAARMVDVTAGRVTLAEVLPEVPDGAEGLRLIEQAMKHTAYGSDDEMLLTALMLLHSESEPYDGGVPTKYIAAALQQTFPAQVDCAEEIAALENLLSSAAKKDQISALGRFVKQKQLPEGLLAAFGRAMTHPFTLEERLAQCAVISAAGHDPVEYLRAGINVSSVAEAEALAAAFAGTERTLLLRAMASSFTDVNDVLAYLRMAKEQGVSAAECYPDGAVITLDTGKWGPYTSPQAASLGQRKTFLVLRRREKAEPYTTFVVPEEEESGLNGELPAGLYEDYDPDADTGAAQYTVWLETSVLDRMPAERIPQTFIQCDALVILDEWYFCDGYVRFTRSVAEDGTWRHRQIDSPSFGVCQEIAVYSRGGGEWLFSSHENVIYSPAMLEENLASTDPLDWNPADHYLAAPDDAWLTKAYADFLFSLERRGWLLVP